MDNNNDIRDLFEKFKAGILSPEESAELSSLLKEGDNNKLLKETMSDFWNQNEMPGEIPSRQMWLKLNSTIETEEEKSERNFFGRTVKFNSMLKYAAVIVATVGVTLFARNITGKSEKSDLASTGEVKYNEVSVSFGSKSRIVLPDGSVVILNSGSKLRYPSQFDEKSRNVYLEGEGFFEVEKKTSQPFLVKTKDITVRVLGTKFNVKSYDDEKTIETTLVSGKVEIFANKDEEQSEEKKIVLQPNQQALFHKESKEISLNNQHAKAEESESAFAPIEIKSTVDIVEVTAWKDNRLVFRNEKFNELATKLERWYDVKIEIEDEELKDILFTGTFQKESVEQALNALKLIMPFEYNMKMNNITIRKNN